MQNLGLAVRAFKELLSTYDKEPGVADSLLVIAGGYDKRLAENREYYAEVQDLVAECGVEQKVSRRCMVPSFIWYHVHASGMRPASCADIFVELHLQLCGLRLTVNEKVSYAGPAYSWLPIAEKGSLLASSF